MTPSKDDITAMVIGIVKQIVEDWGMEAAVENNSKLVGDLGFTSMDVIDLLASLETQMGRKLAYEKLVVLENGGYRQELVVEDLVAFVQENYEHARGASGPV
jgi:acyl carrier protein